MCPYCLCTICVSKYCVVFCSVPGPMSKWNVDALVALKGELKLNVKMIALANILETPAGGFMSRTEAQSVRAKTGDDQQMELIIEILLGKGDKEFATFCQMLQKSNYQVWAHELELEAEKFKISDGMKHPLLAFLFFFCNCGWLQFILVMITIPWFMYHAILCYS